MILSGEQLQQHARATAASLEIVTLKADPQFGDALRRDFDTITIWHCTTPTSSTGSSPSDPAPELQSSSSRTWSTIPRPRDATSLADRLSSREEPHHDRP